MSTITLPRFEACAKIGLGDVINQEELVIDVVLQELGVRALPTDDVGICLVLCPQRNDFAAIRAILPWRYHLEDDGTLWRDGHSTVETHYSVDYVEWVLEMFDPANRDWVKEDLRTGHDIWGYYHSTRYDTRERFQMLRKMFQRKEYAETKAFGHVGPNGKYKSSISAVIDAAETPDVVVCEDITRHTMTGLSVHIAVAGHEITTAPYLRHFTNARTTLGAQLEKAKLGVSNKTNTVPDWASTFFLGTGHREFGRPFVSRLVRERQSAKAGKRLTFLDDELEHAFPEQMFVSTRAHADDALSTWFLRFGLRWDTGGNVGLISPKAHTDIMDVWCDHTAQAFVHWLSDGCRVVFSLPVWYVGSTDGNNLGIFPGTYLISQFIERNEIVFSELTFRGLPLQTQQAIWGVKGLSSALNRALMGLSYEVKRVPAKKGFISISTKRKPSHHRAALLGTGYANTLGAWSTSVASLSENNTLHADSNCPTVFSSSRTKLNLSRTVDILDDLFEKLPDNLLLPGNRCAQPRKIEVVRKVRL